MVMRVVNLVDLASIILHLLTLTCVLKGSKHDKFRDRLKGEYIRATKPDLSKSQNPSVNFSLRIATKENVFRRWHINWTSVIDIQSDTADLFFWADTVYRRFNLFLNSSGIQENGTGTCNFTNWFPPTEHFLDMTQLQFMEDILQLPPGRHPTTMLCHQISEPDFLQLH